MAYCDAFDPGCLEEAESTCMDFILAVKAYKPELLRSQSFIICSIYLVMFDFGPSAAFNTERSVPLFLSTAIHGLICTCNGFIMYTDVNLLMVL